MENLDKIWIVGENLLPKSRDLPSFDGMMLVFCASPESFFQQVKSQEPLFVLVEDKYLTKVRKQFANQIEVMRVGASNPSPQLFKNQITVFQSELRLMHDHAVVEDVAWSSGFITEAKMIRRITDAMVTIFACKNNSDVQTSLAEIISKFHNVQAVELFVDPPHAPYLELQRKDLAIPIQFDGKLYAHVYVTLKEDCLGREEMLADLSEFLLGLSDVVALTLERNGVLADAIQSRHLWQASFDAIEDPVMIIDREMIVQRANRSYLDLVGRTLDEVQNSTCPLFRAEDVVPYMSYPRSEWELQYRSRNFRVFLDKMNVDAEEAQFVIRLQDFTREKKLRETMMAKEQRSNLGVLISSVAHDINNPIGGILAYCQLLERDFTANSSIGADIAVIKEEAERCQKVIQTMLSLVRNVDTHESLYSVSECISSVLNLLGPELKRSQIDVEWQEDSLIRYDLPMVWGRKEKTLQAIFQLLQELVVRLGAQSDATQKLRRQIKIATEHDAELKLNFSCNDPLHSEEIEQSVSFYLASILLEEQGGSLQIRRRDSTLIYQFVFPLPDTSRHFV